MSGKALKAILNLHDKDILSQDGVKLIVEKLKKDELPENFQDLQNF